MLRHIIKALFGSGTVRKPPRLAPKFRPVHKRTKPSRPAKRGQLLRVRSFARTAPAGRQSPALGRRTIVVYHGTPSTENAKSILRDGWMTGAGNAAGDGRYLTKDLGTAKSYAGSQGVYLRCKVTLGRCCYQWNPSLDQEYQRWCQARRVAQDNSAKTAFLLNKGYDTLLVADTVVVLSPQFANPSAYKMKDPRIQVLSIHRAADGRRIRV